MQGNKLDNDEWCSALNSIGDGMLIVDKEWNFKWCNTSFISISDLRREYIEGCGIIEFLHEFFDFDLKAFYQQAILEQGLIQVELFNSTKNQWNLLSIFPYPQGMVLVFRDISKGIEGEQNLLIDENNLHILINITSQPIWLVDNNCKIVLCNTAFRKWISYFIGSELEIGDNVLDANLGDAYLNKFRMCYELALSGKSFVTVEDMLVDNELKFTTINFGPVFDANGTITGISCHATDITDQRRNLSQLDEQTQLLLEIANIQSHKVRGPVATIMGLVRVFNFEDISDPQNAEVMVGITEVAERLDIIVREVIRSINLLSKKK